MGLIDKAKNKAEELLGKGKEVTGEATNNTSLTHEGQADQGSASTKQAGENIKDIFKGEK